MSLPLPDNDCKIIEPWGTTKGRKFPHTGCDFASKTPGKIVPARSTWAGTVIYSGTDSGAGNWIVTEHLNYGGTGRNVWAVYGHLSSFIVRKGAVSEGQNIGMIGNTGNSFGVHLHLSFYPTRAAALARNLTQHFDPWPLIQATLNKPQPKPPAKTQEQKDQEEIMGAVDTLVAEIRATRQHTQEVSNNDRKWMLEQLAIETSRMRRESAPEPTYIKYGADGKEYDLYTSPYAVAENRTGFILPLSGPGLREGQLASLRAYYRIAAFDYVGTGMHEKQFWNQQKDLLRGTGRIDPQVSEEEGVKLAKQILFGVK